jgi:hypothetical protein
VKVALPSLSGLSASERWFVGTVLGGLAQGCRARGRPALAAVFHVLAEAVSSARPPRGIELEPLADLDDGELEDLTRVLQARRGECERQGAAGEAAFYADVLVGLDHERERRAKVLTAIDGHMTWYEQHTSL